MSTRRNTKDLAQWRTFGHNSISATWFVKCDKLWKEFGVGLRRELSLSETPFHAPGEDQISHSLSIREEERSNNSMSKVWLITGSSRGIGRKVAEAALLAGEQVVATARKLERLHELVDQHGDRIRTVQHDVRDASAAATAVQTAVDAFDRIDVVVNAARSPDPTVEDFSDESFRVPVETNLFGFAYLIDAVLPILREQKCGHIIEISPAGSRIPALGLSAHHIAIRAVKDFTLELAHEVATLGIKVTIVETGSTHNTRLEPDVPVISEPFNENVIAPSQGARAHDRQGPNDPGEIARLILRTAEMAEPPLRLLVGSEATHYLTDPSQSLGELEAKWRN